jgi:hypothetical protein
LLKPRKNLAGLFLWPCFHLPKLQPGAFQFNSQFETPGLMAEARNISTPTLSRLALLKMDDCF